jgi:hypothetical protein
MEQCWAWVNKDKVVRLSVRHGVPLAGLARKAG